MTNFKKLNELLKPYLTSGINKDEIDPVIKKALAGDVKDISSFLEPTLAEMVRESSLVRYDSVGLGSKLDARATIGPFLKENPALWILAVHASRSAFVTKQTLQPNYCALVPLLLSAFKRYADIPYSSWTNLAGIVENNLLTTMLSANDECWAELRNLSRSELVDLREKLLTVQSGISKGIRKDPVSTAFVYPYSSNPLYPMNFIGRVMAIQIWCAHPSIRNKYMILDPNDWDSIPEPIISTEVILPTVTEEKPKKNAVAIDLPWL